jgi:S1-C subfamily serine protease
MPRILTPLVLAIVLSASMSAQDWARLAQRTEASTVSITYPVADGERIGTYQCTGFVINDERDYILTCQHCLGPDPSVVVVDGQKLTGVVFQSDADDIAVIAAATVKPALHPYLGPIRKGEPIMSVGYGFGLGAMVFRAGHVAHPRVQLPGIPGPYLMSTNAWIEGMSGAPMVNARGLVVSLVQRSHPQGLVGIGRPMTDIYAVTAALWGK